MGSFPLLWTLSLPRTSLEGALPGNWGNNTVFPSLTNLDLSGNRLNGTLPAQWGDDTNFDYLRKL